MLLYVGAGSKQSMENWCMRRCHCNLSLSKNKQIFDTYNFKKALKRVGLIQEVIYSCFAAYGMRFLARKSTESDLFVVLFCVCLLKVWNIFFVFRR